MNYCPPGHRCICIIFLSIGPLVAPSSHLVHLCLRSALSWSTWWRRFTCHPRIFFTSNTPRFHQTRVSCVTSAPHQRSWWFHSSLCVNFQQVQCVSAPSSSGSPEPSGTDTLDFYIWRMPEHDTAIQLNLALSTDRKSRTVTTIYNIRLLFKIKYSMLSPAHKSRWEMGAVTRRTCIWWNLEELQALNCVWECPYSMWECPYEMWEYPYILWECPYIMWECLYSMWECPYSVWECSYSIWECPYSVWECSYSIWECPYRVVKDTWYICIQTPCPSLTFTLSFLHYPRPSFSRPTGIYSHNQNQNFTQTY